MWLFNYKISCLYYEAKVTFAIILLFIYLDHGRYELVNKALTKSTIRRNTEANGYMGYHTTC